MYFDAPEKKCELRLKPNSKSFRDKGRKYWEAIVEKSEAKILSSVSNANCDAYLLSESSLFVYAEKIVMITCGKTRLSVAIVEVLKDISIKDIDFFIYERKQGKFSETQPLTVEEDIEMISKAIPVRAFCFNDQGHSPVHFAYLAKENEGIQGDQTFELLMHDLSEETISMFSQRNQSLQSQKLKKLHEVVKGHQIDEYFFEPAGYSLNAIKGEYYFTVHVTPQEIGSYVSVESNMPGSLKNLELQVQKILEVFQPKQFDFFHFEPRTLEDSVHFEAYESKEKSIKVLECGYTLSCNHFYQKSPEGL